MAIAKAFGHAPISLLLICIDAQVRMTQTLDQLDDPLNMYEEFDDILCPMITKMDKVTWTPKEFLQLLEGETGYNHAVFTGRNTEAKVLKENILNACKKPWIFV
eukprot:TRINITY_DN1178_c0_g1_i1.p1 TRINITY_DN1178_c0_g1~~TRINITY_DN1178_c0_g1_i1.p1  ORF type:complete len:104 (-),score=14.06 TRINITY_DN1178_c0_g1_i1:105-416(-)